MPINLQIQDAPTVAWGAEEGSFYTIIMTGRSLLSNYDDDGDGDTDYPAILCASLVPRLLFKYAKVW